MYNVLCGSVLANKDHTINSVGNGNNSLHAPEYISTGEYGGVLIYD